MNTVAQAKSGERTRFWITDHTNRSAIITLITQNLALMISRVVTEQEGVEELCLMQEEEWGWHCHLHLPPPPSPGSKSSNVYPNVICWYNQPFRRNSRHGRLIWNCAAWNHKFFRCWWNHHHHIKNPIIIAWIITLTTSVKPTSEEPQAFPQSLTASTKPPSASGPQTLSAQLQEIGFRFDSVNSLNKIVLPWWVLWSASSSSIMGVSRGPDGRLCGNFELSKCKWFLKCF